MRRALVGLTTFLLLAIGLVAVPSQVANALSGNEFNAGYIVSDQQFYDGNAMTQNEIQAFLDSQIGACTNGMCLNVLVTDVSSRPRIVSDSTGNVRCEAFTGGHLSAAAIIYRAQAACGISAKVILVTLQKEQGLVTKTAPSQAALDRAMGMACPDTAPCAPASLGFGNQVYVGALQLKTYKASRFGMQPGLNSIRWNPNSACGSSTVNVQNYATAALYNYTPYQPNAAALSNLSATGDGCSSYGNRNFWVYYNNWFGSPIAPVAVSSDLGTFVLGRDSSGILWQYPADGSGGWLPRVQVGNGWNSMTAIVTMGDLDGDGHKDLLARDSSGVLWLYPGTGQSSWLTPRRIGNGWNGMTAITSPGDFNGDGVPDVLARDSAGVLWLYPGDGHGGVLAGRQVATGWGGMTAIFSAGDFNGDGRSDVLARDASGVLWLYPGDGKGGFNARSQVGNGWGDLTAIFSPGDFNGDGHPDLLARDASGVLWLYPGDGEAGFSARSQVGNGWGGITAMAGSGSFGAGFTADNAPVAPDPGDSGGSQPVVPELGDPIIGVRDFSGDGLPDVLARDGDGVWWLYPGNGSGGWLGSSQVGSDWGGMTAVFSTGDFNGDGRSDVLARDASGVLWLYPGDGKGGSTARSQVGNGWGGMTAVFSAGDFNGDGRSDVLARDGSGLLWLYLGDGKGGFAARSQVGNGWGKFK